MKTVRNLYKSRLIANLSETAPKLVPIFAYARSIMRRLFGKYLFSAQRTALSDGQIYVNEFSTLVFRWATASFWQFVAVIFVLRPKGARPRTLPAEVLKIQSNSETFLNHNHYINPVLHCALCVARQKRPSRKRETTAQNITTPPQFKEAFVGHPSEGEEFGLHCVLCANLYYLFRTPLPQCTSSDILSRTSCNRYTCHNRFWQDSPRPLSL